MLVIADQEPRAREKEKERDRLESAAIKVFEGSLARNNSKELGGRGEKAGLHCCHSNGELRKL